MSTADTSPPQPDQPAASQADADRKAFAARLSYWMEQGGIKTQAELAKRSGLQPPQISRYLSAKEMPGLSTLAVLCGGIGVDMRMFWSPTNDEITASQAAGG